MSAPSLKNYRILIADRDRELADVLSKMLQNMGFSTPQITKSGQDVLNILGSQTFDFLITEWNTAHLSGVETINRIRTDKDSPCPTLPIIMLTGRAEQSDVMAARDAGVNEFVVKPFSAKTVYNRLERIIEQPRNFVVSDGFVGPDRRHKGAPPPGVKDRRVRELRPSTAQNITSKMIATTEIPRLWTPDFSLKAKLGSGVTLNSLITPEVLNVAQAAVNAITQESLTWVKDDLQRLKQLAERLSAKDATAPLASEIEELALSISSRAGTFGYKRMAEISYMLYLFCRNYLQPGVESHAVIVNKHIDVLFVIVGQQLTGENDKASEDIILGLRLLTQKFTQA